jgi:CubicO group peptidase (beta-lactamase class C family)
LARHAGAAGVNLFGGGAPDIPLVFEPGERWQYGIGVDWAGVLIQQASGLPLADYMAQNIFTPLGMTDTSFFPGQAQAARQASVHQRQEDGGLAVIPFGMPSEPHFGMGGGGLYATAADYLTFLTAILGGGAVGAARILKPETVALMTTNQVGDLQSGILRSAQPALSNDFDAFPGMEKRWGLGFLINQDKGPAGRSAGSLAWAGLANCYYWADPATGVAGVFMSQVLPFADPSVLDAFAAFEASVYA